MEMEEQASRILFDRRLAKTVFLHKIDLFENEDAALTLLRLMPFSDMWLQF